MPTGPSLRSPVADGRECRRFPFMFAPARCCFARREPVPRRSPNKLAVVTETSEAPGIAQDKDSLTLSTRKTKPKTGATLQGRMEALQTALDANRTKGGVDRAQPPPWLGAACIRGRTGPGSHAPSRLGRTAATRAGRPFLEFFFSVPRTILPLLVAATMKGTRLCASTI